MGEAALGESKASKTYSLDPLEVLDRLGLLGQILT